VPSVLIARMVRSHSISAFNVALAAHLVDHLACLRGRVVAVLLNPEMRSAGDVDV
jgi:hypothetical protein